VRFFSTASPTDTLPPATGVLANIRDAVLKYLFAGRGKELRESSEAESLQVIIFDRATNDQRSHATPETWPNGRFNTMCLSSHPLL
jgi:hypothetical protein